MDCKEISVLISACQDGELDAPSRTVLQAHLQGCPACRRLMSEHLRCATILLSAWPELEPRPDSWRVVQSSIRRPVMPLPFYQRFRRPLLGVAAAALVILAVTVPILIRSRSSSHPARFDRELADYLSRRESVVQRGNPYTSLEVPPQPETENPFSSFVRSPAKNPFEEMR